MKEAIVEKPTTLEESVVNEAGPGEETGVTEAQTGMWCEAHTRTTVKTLGGRLTDEQYQHAKEKGEHSGHAVLQARPALLGRAIMSAGFEVSSTLT
jgi:hypothetical protein